MKFTHLVRAAAGAAFVLSASVASAQTAFFGQGMNALDARSDLQSFLATTGNNNLNSVIPGLLPASIPLGAFGITIASGSGNVTTTGGGLYCGGRCISGTGVGNASYTFSFNQLINGFGADWFDVGTWAPLSGNDYGVRYTLFNGASQVGNAVFQNWGGSQSSGNLAFFGVFSNQSFNSLVVDVASGDYVEIDNLTVGRASVPEPSTLALTAAGLAGLFGVARRRREA